VASNLGPAFCKANIAESVPEHQESMHQTDTPHTPSQTQLMMCR